MPPVSRILAILPRRRAPGLLALCALAAGLGSALARRLYAENRDRIAVIQNTRPFLADRVASARREHLAILDAIDAADTARAAHEIREHLRHTLRWWGIYPE